MIMSSVRVNCKTSFFSHWIPNFVKLTMRSKYKVNHIFLWITKCPFGIHSKWNKTGLYFWSHSFLHLNNFLIFKNDGLHVFFLWKAVWSATFSFLISFINSNMKFMQAVLFVPLQPPTNPYKIISLLCISMYSAVAYCDKYATATSKGIAMNMSSTLLA